ncbi:MAG: ATP-dependent helicase [Cyanobacteriota bacterium erpe_2018_sw_21hr_WHONDRS-SW48-000092_B_bin.40]|jgi:ERCC4-related helicase|nr:ATP-dependent helicase [Cyanobacteriota bacterium erpe_2018_sw_21hr_WHONDRS-SW48-000092_B_bin.40]
MMRNEHGKSMLRPYQGRFLANFFASSGLVAHILKASSGLGIHTTVAHLVCELLEREPDSRVLIIVPRIGIQHQMHSLLNRLGVHSTAVDRYKFRELQKDSDGSIWSKGSAYILSVQFALKPDVLESITATEWNGFVMLDAQAAAQSRMPLLLGLFKNSRDARALFTLDPADELDLSAFFEANVKVTEWRRSEVLPLVNQGQTLSIFLEVFKFEYAVDEALLLEALRQISLVLPQSEVERRAYKIRFLQRAMSSPLAIEQELRKLRNEIVHGINVDNFSKHFEPTQENLGDVDCDSSARLMAFVPAIENVVNELSCLRIDSKLRALLEMLHDSEQPSNAKMWLCIISDYRATVFYLEAQLNELWHSVYTVHGGMPSFDRQQTVLQFRKSGGILIVTRSALTEGLSFPEVGTVIFYDLPGSPKTFDNVLGRFCTYGRLEPLTVKLLGSQLELDERTIESFERTVHRFGEQ